MLDMTMTTEQYEDEEEDDSVGGAIARYGKTEGLL
jgi:hypothetical protein